MPCLHYDSLQTSSCCGTVCGKAKAHTCAQQRKNAVQYNYGSGPEAAPARRAAHVSRCWSQAALLSSTTSRKNTQILIHLNLNSTNYFQSQNHNWDYTGTLTTQAISMAHCSLPQLQQLPKQAHLPATVCHTIHVICKVSSLLFVSKKKGHQHIVPRPYHRLFDTYLHILTTMRFTVPSQLTVTHK